MKCDEKIAANRLLAKYLNEERSSLSGTISFIPIEQVIIEYNLRTAEIDYSLKSEIR